MNHVDPISSGISRLGPIDKPCCGSDAPPKVGEEKFKGLLEDALRRLEDLDRGVEAEGKRERGDATVEKLTEDLHRAEQSMRSAEEIRAILLRAYQDGKSPR